MSYHSFFIVGAEDDRVACRGSILLNSRERRESIKKTFYLLDVRSS